MLKNILGNLIRFLTIFSIVFTFAIIFVGMFKKEWLELFIEWMKLIISGMGKWNYLIAFISSLIESFPVLGIAIPGTNVLLIVGGFFGEINKTNLIYVIIIASVGATLGNYIGYILGKYYGKEFFKKYGLWFGIGETEVKYLEKGIHKWGALGIVFGKFHATTRTFLPFIAGSMGMHSTKFMIYNVIGSFIRATTIVGLGVLFAAHYEKILDNFGKIFIGIFILGGLYIYKYKKKEFLKYLQEKNEEFERLEQQAKK